MTATPVELLELFERLSIDKKLTFFMKNRHGERVVITCDLLTDKPWTLSLENASNETKRSVTRRKLLEVLQALDCDWSQLENELNAHLMWQAAYCDHFIREISEHLGTQAVQQAILQTQTFMDDLTEAISNTLGAPLPQKAPSDTSSGRRGRFRVIRNPS